MQALVWYVNVLAVVGLMAALVLRGAWRSWPCLTGFIFASFLRDMALLLLERRTDPYFATYILTEPLVLATLAGAVMESWRRRTAGIVSVGQAGGYLFWLALGLASAVTIAGSTLGGEWVLPLKVALSARQCVLSGLAGFMLISLIALEALRVRAAPAVQFEHRVLSVYLFVQALAMSAGALTGQAAMSVINTFSLAAGAIVYIFWAARIQPVPAESAPHPGLRAEAAEAQMAEVLTTMRTAAKSLMGR